MFFFMLNSSCVKKAITDRQHHPPPVHCASKIHELKASSVLHALRAYVYTVKLAPPVYKMDSGFFFASVGLTYKQSAVKLVVWVLKSGPVLYK